MSFSIVILGAGESRRILSKTSKVLHKIGGLSVIDHVTKAALTLNPDQVITVVSPGLAPFFPNAVIQPKAQGTGDALRCALPFITSERVLVLYGDVPLWNTDFLKELLKHPMAVLSMIIDDLDATYGRLILKGEHVQEIREYKEASEKEKKISLANTGIGVFETPFLKGYLPLLEAHNGEFYLTDLIQVAYKKGTPCVHVTGPTLHGVNTRKDLSKAEEEFQNFYRNKALEEGVTLIGPETIFFSHDTKIFKDCQIGPHVTFGPQVILEENVKILSFCHIENAHIKSQSIVGPFAHLRGGVVLEKDVHIGNFVEVKASHLYEKTRVKHLSYIGDATLGKNVNIGAGTITCNYNGVKKFKTIIEEGVFVGSNTTLIAPITLGAHSYIAAGTVVTKSVPEKTLAIARIDTKHKER